MRHGSPHTAPPADHLAWKIDTGDLKALPGPSPHPDSSRSELGSTYCVTPGKPQALMRPKHLIKGGVQQHHLLDFSAG